MEATRREYRRLVLERGKEGKWRERSRGKGEGREGGKGRGRGRKDMKEKKMGKRRAKRERTKRREWRERGRTEHSPCSYPSSLNGFSNTTLHCGNDSTFFRNVSKALSSFPLSSLSACSAIRSSRSCICCARPRSVIISPT